jgi:aldehyde:ferredoxin oxidoreductase
MSAMPYKNFQYGIIPEEIAARNNPMTVVDKYQVARQSFPGCVIGCGRFLEITEGPYKGLRTFGPQCEAVANFQGKLAVEEVTFSFMANALCNQLGIDLDFSTSTIAWAIECYEKGILTKEDTDGMELKWGDEKMIVGMIEKITHRQGFGNLLAEGVLRASDRIKRNSAYYAIHLKGQELYETLRGSNAWALGALTSTRGGGHTTGSPVYEQYEQMTPEDAERMFQFFGIRGIDKPQEYEGKPELVHYFEVLHRICNSVGICHFNTVWSQLDYINLEDIAELLSSATGIEFTTNKLEEIAMRQLSMEKAINLKLTGFSRKDDMPDERELNEPIKFGKLDGWKFDKDKLNAMLDRYYDLHGWDRKTSYPTRETLEKYGLKHVADELEKIGRLGEAK